MIWPNCKLIWKHYHGHWTKLIKKLVTSEGKGRQAI